MLGVDVGKAELYGTWRDPESRRVRWQGPVPNTPAGIRELLRRAPETALVVEPTGRYGEALIRAAQAAGREVDEAVMAELADVEAPKPALSGAKGAHA